MTQRQPESKSYSMPPPLRAFRIQTDSIEYANSRVRGQRTKLISNDELQHLLDMGTVQEMITYLSGSKYDKYLSKSALTQEGASVVGMAAAEYLHETTRQTVNLYPPKSAQCLVVLAAQGDITDLKTLVRGKLAGTASDVLIDSFIGAGITIARKDLQLLATAPSLQDAIAMASALAMPYARAFREGARLIRGSEERLSDALAQFELVLDRTYYAWALDTLGGSGDKSDITYDYIRTNIDMGNIILAMRAVVAQIEVSDVQTYFIEGGAAIDRRKFIKLVKAQTIDELVELLRNTPYFRVLDKALSEYVLSNSLSAFDSELHLWLYKEMLQTGKRDYLGLGLPVAYLLALQAETTNLRIIAHAKEFSIAPDVIREELILV